jgi:hypothetical protein
MVLDPATGQKWVIFGSARKRANGTKRSMVVIVR